MPSSDREDNRLYPTIFILWGEEPICMMLFGEHGMGLLPARLGIGSKWTCWRLLRHLRPLYPAPAAWRLSQLAPLHHQK
jgi:hypothetical protein